MIILNERKWAEDALAGKTFNGDMFGSMKLVSCLFADRGMTKSETRDAVVDYILACSPRSSIVKMDDSINAAVGYGHNHKLLEVDAINVYDEEIKIIRGISHGKQTERLAFTLLCLSKYWNIKLDSDKSWVNTKTTGIMRLANIRTSVKRQGDMYNYLKEDGLITLSKRVDCTNVRVDFSSEIGDIAISITDFRNLGNQYLMYIGEPFFVCAECGAVTKMNNPGIGRNQKYCADCAMAVKAAQSIQSAKRIKLR